MAQKDLATTIDYINLIDLGAIDRADLFTEIEKFASTYGEYSGYLLSAVNLSSAAKTQLEHLEGQIDLAARQQSEVSGAKVTEAKIKASVRATSTWTAGKALLDESEGRVEKCKAALRTLDKKERMLDLLGRLAVREYSATQRS